MKRGGGRRGESGVRVEVRGDTGGGRGALCAQVLITNLGEEQVSNLPTVRDTYMRLREVGGRSVPSSAQRIRSTFTKA